MNHMKEKGRGTNLPILPRTCCSCRLHPAAQEDEDYYVSCMRMKGKSAACLALQVCITLCESSVGCSTIIIMEFDWYLTIHYTYVRHQVISAVHNMQKKKALLHTGDRTEHDKVCKCHTLMMSNIRCTLHSLCAIHTSHAYINNTLSCIQLGFLWVSPRKCCLF